MPANIRSRWQIRPPRPTLAKGRSFTGLLWAAGMGWTKGFNPTTRQDTPSSLIEDGRAATDPGRGFFEGGAGGTTAANYSAEQVGIGSVIRQDGEDIRFSNFTPPTGPPEQNYNISFGMTAMCLIRPIAIATTTANMALQWRLNSANIDAGGWNFSANVAGGYDAVIADAALVEKRASSTTLQDVTRTDCLVMRYDQTNLDLFVNGVREGRTATNIVIAQPNRAIRWGNPVAGTFWNFVTTMGALWSRALSDSEIAGLYTDPFMIYRWMPTPMLYGLPDFAVVGGGGLAAAPLIGSGGGCDVCSVASALLF